MREANVLVGGKVVGRLEGWVGVPHKKKQMVVRVA
jgi:hypothetical protein